MGSQPFVAVEGRSEPVFSFINPAGSLLSPGATCRGPWTNGAAGDGMTDGIESCVICCMCGLLTDGHDLKESERSLLKFLLLPSKGRQAPGDPGVVFVQLPLLPRSLPAGQGAEADAKKGDAHTMDALSDSSAEAKVPCYCSYPRIPTCR
ncbi:hypothetical protein CGRA01v4_12967 [Colletotrichum graminicola]|nr:hypothetical protein CGRA01v4_12967 [Colletotrichum graminicola]